MLPAAITTAADARAIVEARGLSHVKIGVTDIDLFARMVGIEFQIEGPVGQMAIGRGADGETTPLAD